MAAHAIHARAELAVFGGARDAFVRAVKEAPANALPYLKPGDIYSLGGLVVHANFVLEHYLNVLRALKDSDFGECRPEDPAGLKASAEARAASSLTASEVEAALADTARLHEEVVTVVTGFESLSRHAGVWFPGAAETYPTSVADVLCWLTDHYREHVPQIGALVSDWRRQEECASAVATVERFNLAFGRGDVDGVMALMTDDVVFENTYPPPDGERHQGQAAVRRFWESFFSGTVKPRFETEEMFPAGDRVVARWRFAWGEGASEGHVRGVDVFRIRDGKVAEKLSYVKG